MRALRWFLVIAVALCPTGAPLAQSPAERVPHDPEFRMVVVQVQALVAALPER